MDKQADFIQKNIERELLALGHTDSTARSVAESMRIKYINGCNWPKGAVFGELMKQAKKDAGKPKQKGVKK